MTLVLDTSGLLSALDGDQRLHQAARESLESATGALVVSPFVLAELDYLLSTKAGSEAELALLEEVARGDYRLEPFSSAADVARARAVIERHKDFGDLRLADATKIVLAERHDTRDILTLDERLFRALDGPRGLPFRLLPADG